MSALKTSGTVLEPGVRGVPAASSQLREDDPWWVRRGYGLLNTGLLRAIAYNVLAIARAVHLRRQRLIGWQQLRDWLRDALVWWGLLDSTESQPPASTAPA